jgi:hypothetical protein
MIHQISTYLQGKLRYSNEDSILLNGKHFPIDKEKFQLVTPLHSQRVTYIDGGQAEILSAANFCLSFIRVVSLSFNGAQKSHIKKEFFVLTTAAFESKQDDIIYTSKIFGDELIDENTLTISSTNATIRNGQERAPISKVANMARRFAELTISKLTSSKENICRVLLDGTLQPTYPGEEKLLAELNVSAIAKSSSLFTTSGNNPNILLGKLGPKTCWSYPVDDTTSFVKLHEKATHVFRFTSLIPNCSDPLFLGYPYGLILADKLARISNTEKSSLQAKFLLNTQNKDIIAYLQTTNAHDILDAIS